MTPSPSSSPRLDYAPLTARLRLGARLRAASGNNLTVLGLVMGGLLIVVPSVILVTLFATGNATDGGGLVFLVMLLGSGTWVVVSALRRAGGALDAFAEANGLTLVRGTQATEYRGSLFADATYVVDQSVRTSGETFVEVGDRFPITKPTLSTLPSAEEQRRPALFLRGRLGGQVEQPLAESGLVTPGVVGHELVTPELDAALRRFAGSYWLEVAGDELTVFGSRALKETTQDRVAEAFALTDALVDRANATLSLVADETPRQRVAPDPYARESVYPRAGDGATSSGRPMGAMKVVALTLVILVGASVAFAVVMSILDDSLHGHRQAAQFVVGLGIAAMLALVTLMLRVFTRPRRKRKRRDPGTRPVR